eukprot:3877867-Rhodomonas_salina.1
MACPRHALHRRRVCARALVTRALRSLAPHRTAVAHRFQDSCREWSKGGGAASRKDEGAGGEECRCATRWQLMKADVETAQEGSKGRSGGFESWEGGRERSRRRRWALGAAHVR